MDEARLRKLVVQHAKTSSLLGVEFVPVYRTGSPQGSDDPLPLNGHATAASSSTGQFAAEPAAPSAAVPAPLAPSSRPSPRLAPPPAATPRVPTPSPLSGIGDLLTSTKSMGAVNRPVIQIPDLGPRPRDPKKVQAALDALRARYEADAPHKTFHTKFQNLVFGEGDPCARLVFVGEAPGEEEDKTGRPFVGRAGGLLDKMIAGGMGLTREQIYICNVLKTRPIDNATPTTQETEACKPYLLAQLGILAPDVIITLGKPAAQCLLESQEAVGKMRGTWRQLKLPSGQTIAVMPTFHPAYLLRAYTDENRRMVWSDLKKALAKLSESGQ